MQAEDEEVYTQLHTQNAKALASVDLKGITPQQILLLLDAAALRGFLLGTNLSISTFSAQFALLKASLPQ